LVLEPIVAEAPIIIFPPEGNPTINGFWNDDCSELTVFTSVRPVTPGEKVYELESPYPSHRNNTLITTILNY
jgi:hypothetical protein